MLIKDLIESLQILSKHFPDLILQSGHDVIWACGRDEFEELPEDDRTRLEQLGWYDDYSDALAHNM